MSVDKGKGPIFDPGLCRLCGTMKKCRLLNVEYQCMGKMEVYADMIMDCFGLLQKKNLLRRIENKLNELSHLDGKPSERLVCATCVTRLREAFAFRRQVLQCEEAFLQMRMDEADDQERLARVEAAAKIEVEIKPEPEDDTDHDDDTVEPVKMESCSVDSDDLPLKRKKTSNGALTVPAVKPSKMVYREEPKMTIEDKAELRKHRTNIRIIIESSNATPIRCFSDSGYKCSHCNSSFRHPIELKSHTLNHDMKIRRYLMQRNLLPAFLVRLDITDLKCQICDLTFDMLEDLIDHLIKTHDRKLYKDVKSRILPFKFNNTGVLKCVYCEKIFMKFRCLQEHMSVHFRNFICDVCETGFPTKRMIAQHLNSHKIGVFQCVYCQKVFNTDQKKQQHEKFVHLHGKTNFLNKCGICKERFKSYRTKEQHLLEVHGLSSAIKCQACDRVFKNQRFLTIHVQRDHLMRRPHKCLQCDMSFYERQELQNHMVKHTGLKNFKCEICCKSYGRKKTLKEHLRIHTADRRFRCELCGQTFVQKCSWRGHMRSKHGAGD